MADVQERLKKLGQGARIGMSFSFNILAYHCANVIIRVSFDARHIADERSNRIDR